MGEGGGGSARAKGSGWVGVGEDGMVVVRGSTKGGYTGIFSSKSVSDKTRANSVTIFPTKKNRMARGVSPPRHPICCSHGRTAST